MNESNDFLEAQLQAEHNTRLAIEQYAADWKKEGLHAKSELIKCQQLLDKYNQPAFYYRYLISLASVSIVSLIIGIGIGALWL